MKKLVRNLASRYREPSDAKLRIGILEDLIREMQKEQEIYDKKNTQEQRIMQENNSYNADGSEKSPEDQLRDAIVNSGYQQEVANSFIELLSKTEAKLYYKAKKYSLISIDDQMLLESQLLKREMFRVKNEWISRLKVQNRITQARLEVEIEEEESDKEILLHELSKFFRSGFFLIKGVVATPFEYYLKLSQAVQIAILLLILSIFGLNTFAQPILDHFFKP